MVSKALASRTNRCHKDAVTTQASPPPSPKICLYTRAWRSSGTGLFAQELAHGLADIGVPLTFLAPRNQEQRFERVTPTLTRWRPPHEKPGAGRIGNAVRSLSRMLCGLGMLLAARLTHRLFIITIPDPLLFSVPVVALLRLSGAKIIWIAHDPLPHAWHLPRWLRGVERAAHQSCYRLSHRVIVLSDPTRAAMEREFPDLADRLSIIEHGVFPIAGVEPLPGEGHLLLFGSLRRNKGIVEAMKGVIAARTQGCPVRAIVAGSPSRDEADYASEIRALAETAPDAIELRLGYVDDDSLLGLLQRCDALILAYTEFSSQSGVALLAASNARPIIATQAGGIGALIAEGMPCAVIEPPVSAATIADAVRRFAARPVAHWREEALAYRDRTMAVRSWTSIARQYEAVARALSRVA